MKAGSDDGQSAAFSSSRLAQLEQVLDSLPTNAAGEISIDDVYKHLASNHSYLKDAVPSPSSTLALLLRAHASFPFAGDVPLTKDALVRSVGLLTQSSDAMFAQSADVGNQPAIRPRSKTARMEFLFTVLARPDTKAGIPTKDDVLDVLCRIRYPAPSSPSYSQRRPLPELEPVATRLLPASLPSRDGLRVALVDLRPLADLCNAMKEDKGAAAERLLESKEEIGKEEFIEWAKAVSG